MKNMKNNWWLGFLGVFGFQGISNLIKGDLSGAVWIVWFIWFMYFMPNKK